MKIKKRLESTKVGFYTYIKEYFANLKGCQMLAMLILLCFVWDNSLAFDGQFNAPTKINLKLTAVSIKDGLSALEKKAGCVINYNRSIFKDNVKINLDLRNMKLEDALKKVLTGTRVAFKFADHQTVLLYKLPDPVKPGKISGKVMDERGETMPGASIRIIETGAAVQTEVDGSYTININPGTYTVEVSYISYQTQHITGVLVAEGKNTPLNISMKPSAKGLKQVVVTASYRKASIAGLLVRQKNASEISNGISAEQLSRTPDKNIGESLKRISGVNSVDNKFVLVRGIGERYNSAMLDGVVLPSTEAQSRNFSFDLIPSNMVDNVVVSKTVTPDMNASFGGGLIQINTKDIPSENFTSFSAGVSYNDQATGKDFMSHKLGKYDYLGFDDGGRSFPKDIKTTFGLTDEQIIEQSKKFTNDNFTLYRNKALPSQNYQFTMGRLFALNTKSNTKLGFTGSLSYRNTQSNNIISHQRRGSWDVDATNAGNAYKFNTTWGGLLNVGLQLGKNRFSFRNTYAHIYDNELNRTIGYSLDRTLQGTSSDSPPSQIKEADDPTYTNLLQNKLSGQHQLGKVKINWDAARTAVGRQEKDLTIAESYPYLIGNDYYYYYTTSPSSEPKLQVSRHNYRNKEQHYSWNLAATIPFTIGETRNTIKTGYFGIQKKGNFNWVIAPFTHSASAHGKNEPDSLKLLPIAEKIKPEHIRTDGFQYTISPFFLDYFEGISNSYAGFIMFDNRLTEQLRLVWGIRGEYYKYRDIHNPRSRKDNEIYLIKPDPRWQWLPSANLTYSPFTSINIRGAFSSSVVRPELMDNSQFSRYIPKLDGTLWNEGLYSTRINCWDFKTEWFLGLGEIISAGAFYKNFSKPTELVARQYAAYASYSLKSADYAKVYGLEFELRKNFGFIANHKILNNLSVYGNLTLQKSEIRATYKVKNPAGDANLEVSSRQSRAMYGQTPYLVNAGLQYTGNRFGFNIIYNKSGRKTYLVNEKINQVEYEQPRVQLDAQLSYKLLKNRLEIRLNAGNLLNSASIFYSNFGSYEENPDAIDGDGDNSDTFRLKPGFTDNYEDGDRITFSQKFGRSFSTALTWKF